jgi:uncharacterized delta-60 repeat protein
MKKSLLILILLFLCLSCVKVFSQAGTLDLSYGTSGRVHTSYSPASFLSKHSVMQDNGYVVLMGSYSFPASGVIQIGLSRHQVDGTIDTSFGVNGFLNINVNDKTYGNSIVLQQDGKIVVAGYISTSASTRSLLVIRLNSNGSFDSTFGTNGITLFNNDIKGNSVEIQSDNKIVIGGGNVDSDFALVRLNPDGSLDNSFGFNGVVTTTINSSNYESEINVISLQNDGKILASGFAYLDFVNRSFCMVRYNTDGSIDSSFGTNGDGKVLTDINTSASDEILAQAILENDKIVVTGVTGATAVLARYTNDGVLDTSFGSNGLSLYMFGTTCTSRDLLIQPDNKIVIVGESFLPNNKYLIARYTEDGILDTTFNTMGYNLGNFSTNNNKFNSVLMQSDGKLLATGWNQIGNGVYTTIARFHSGLNLNVNEFNNESFVVYPNPSSGIVSINTTGGTVKRVRVLNGLGQEVLPMMDLVEDNTVVDLSGLMVGVYWMALELGDGRQVVKKLVIE